MFSKMMRNTLVAAALAFNGALPVAHAASLEPVTITVPTIAQLRLTKVPDSYIGSLVYVSEYATGNDTGGGWFKIKSASCTDDNGYKIALQGSHCAWRQGVENGFSVTDFGAVTNNTATDNSAAFNYAELAACAANAPTKTIKIPKANSYYLWSSATPWTITCSGTSWIGVGNALIYFTNSSLPYCLINSNSSLQTGLSMEGISFETNQGASVTTCLYLKGITGIFRGISFPKEISNGFKNPIRVESDDTHLAISNSFYNIGVRTYCDASSIGVNFVAAAATLNYGITTEMFFGGEVNSCQGKGIRTEGGITVYGTIFEETPDICIEFVNPSGAGLTSDSMGSAIVGAYFEGCATYNIKYNGSRVYWNTDIATTVATTPKIYDSTRRNWHNNSPYQTVSYERIPIPAGTTTPDVTVGTAFLTQNVSPTSITDFLMSGSTCNQGRSIMIWINDTNTTIVNGGNIRNAGGANNTAKGWYNYFCATGDWYQTSFGAL